MDEIRYFYPSVDSLNILEKYSKDDDFKKWFKVAKIVLENKEYQKRRLFLHHKNESVWSHSIKVSFLSFKIAKRMNVNTYNVIIAGLLHDFYIRAWQYSYELEYLDEIYKERFIKGLKVKSHAFYHPIESLNNSKKYFDKLLNEKIEDAIVKHMFPLSLFTKYKIPKYKESIIVMMVDKYVSLNIIFQPKIFINSIKNKIFICK